MGQRGVAVDGFRRTRALQINVAPDVRVLAFAFLISLVTAILFRTAPALRARRIDLTPVLKEGRGAVPVGSGGRLAKTLIVSQGALSLVRLVGAGVFLRTLVKLGSVDTGFDKQDVLLFGIDPVDVGYKLDSQLASLYQQIEQAVSAQPGVRAASISQYTFNQGASSGGVLVQGSGPSPESAPNVIHNVVGPRYFATMGIPLLVGRVFGPQDTRTSPKVAVINETMAKEYFPGGSPIGRRFGIGDDPKHSSDLELIGVVKDAKYISLRERPQPAAYYPNTQHLDRYCHDFEVRYAGDLRAIVAEVRRAVHDLDSRLPVSYQNTLAQQVSQSVSSQAVLAQLSTFFGLLAVFLACNRDLWSHVLRRHAADKRNRHPHGVRSEALQRALDGDRGEFDVGSARSDRRIAGRLGVRPARRRDALRASANRSANDDGRSNATTHFRVVSRLHPCPAGDKGQPHDGLRYE